MGSLHKIKIKDTKHPFKFGNCVLCCLTSITNKPPSYFKLNYGIGEKPISNEKLIECLTQEFNMIIVIKNKNMINLEIIFKKLSKNRDFIAVYDYHVMHIRRNRIFDTHAKDYKETILQSIPSHLIELI